MPSSSPRPGGLGEASYNSGYGPSTPRAAFDPEASDLPPERLAEVEDFVDFLRHRDDDLRLTQAAARLSEASFQKIWDNHEDAVYDDL